MIPAAFEYHAPATLRQAAALLRRYPGEAKLLAGGHSLLPMMKLRLAVPAHVVDLSRIADLAYIREADGGLALGSMATYYAVESSPLVRRHNPALAEAMSVVADLQVRNMGTIGGALAHADPAGDFQALALALEARIRTSGSGRSRSLAADRFFKDIFTTALEETEIIREVFIPQLPANTGGSYQKFANKASHFAVVGVAAFVTLNAGGSCQRARVAVTGAGPIPVRARAVERYLRGKEPSPRNLEQAAARAADGIEFLSDLHGSADYRRHLTGVFTGRALAQAVSRAADQPAAARA